MLSGMVACTLVWQVQLVQHIDMQLVSVSGVWTEPQCFGAMADRTLRTSVLVRLVLALNPSTLNPRGSGSRAIPG